MNGSQSLLMKSDMASIAAIEPKEKAQFRHSALSVMS